MRENPYSSIIETFHRQPGDPNIMMNLINQMARLRNWQLGMSAASANPADHGVANGLMQSAEARAGQNPHEAAELRGAACAFLSVVR